MSKVYEGWQKKTPGSKEATWAKQEQEYDASIIQQLDPFHIHQAVLRKIRNKKMAKKIRKYINKNNFEDVFIELEGLYDVEKNEREREKILELMTYLSQNVDHLERYTKRNLSLLEGIEYRGMGTIEGSQHNVICDRMKNRGMSWSTEGANKMAKLLCFKHSDGLEDVFETMLPADKNTVVDMNISEIIEKAQKESEKSASKFLRNSKKSAESYGCHFSPLPFTGVSVTNGRKAIQNMLSSKNLLF